MIPASAVTPKSLEMLNQYLFEQIWRAQGERAMLEQRWMLFDRLYRALPEKETKTFPFEGAANLSIPVIATDVDTIYSRIMGILFAPENLWSCRPLNDLWVDYAPRLQEFLEYAQKHEIGAYDAVADFTLELCKLGTGILKQRYKREMKQVYQFRETDNGSIEQVLQMLMKDNPVLEHVSLYDFYVPATAKSVEDAAWASERIKLSRNQLEARIAAGVYVVPPGGLTSWYQARGSQMEQQRQRLDLYSPGLPEECELFETWLDWDLGIDSTDPLEYTNAPVRNTGTYDPSAAMRRQAIVATIHMQSQTMVRVDYNPFFNQEKPYSAARYLRQDKRFYGIGLAEMLYMFQEEITTMHNQRLDNATLLNSVMLKAKKGIGIKQEEPIFPSRIWLLPNPETDLLPLVMGQKADSTLENEVQSLDLGRKRTGVNDYISGNPTTATGYAPAATSISLLKESAKRFDQVMREIRSCLSESGTRILELYQQFNQHGKEYRVMGEREGAILHQILQFPMQLIRNGIAIDVTATSASANKDVEIRTNTIIMQMITQYYQQVMQAMSYVVNPQVPEPLRNLAFEMANSGGILMKRILDSYGLQDADKLVPQLEQILSGGQQTLNTIGNTFAGGTPGIAGLLPASSGGAPLQGNPGAQGPGSQPYFAGTGVGGGPTPAGGGAYGR